MKKCMAGLLLLAMLLPLIACGGDAPAADTTAAAAVTTAAPETEAPETQAPETQAPATEPVTEAPPAEKGCGGMIAGAVAVIALLGTAIVFKKKD